MPTSPVPCPSTTSTPPAIMLPCPSPVKNPPRKYGPLLELPLSKMTNCPDSKLLGGTLAVTVTVCVAVLVGSVVDVAVIVTVPPAGTTAGAVNVVAAPLAVWGGEKVPHAPELPQVTVQSTPLFAGSLLTVATKGALALCTIVSFTIFWVIATESGAVTDISTVAIAKIGAAVEAARIKTWFTAVGGAL